MRRLVGVVVLWMAAVVLVLVAALDPDVDEFDWGQSAASGWGRVVTAATMAGILVSVLWDRLFPTLIGWGALAAAVWAGYAFNAGAWVVAALSTGLLLVLLLVATGEVVDVAYEEATQRQDEVRRRAQPPSLGELRAMRAEVQESIDEHRAGHGTGDLDVMERVRDQIDEEIRERELDEGLRGR